MGWTIRGDHAVHWDTGGGKPRCGRKIKRLHPPGPRLHCAACEEWVEQDRMKEEAQERKAQEEKARKGKEAN